MPPRPIHNPETDVETRCVSFRLGDSEIDKIYEARVGHKKEFRTVSGYIRHLVRTDLARRDRDQLQKYP